MNEIIQPTHPGVILLEGIVDNGLKVKHVAEDLQVPVSTLYAVTKGQRPVSPELALKIAHYFGTTPEYWVNLQADYELRVAKQTMANSLKDLPVFQAA